MISYDSTNQYPQPRTELYSFLRALVGVDSEAALNELEVAYLGPKGSVTRLRGEMGKLPPAERKGFGAEWNRVRDAIETQIGARRAYLRGEVA